jgi:hypothetical protein
LVETILEVYSQCSRVVYLLDTSAVRFGYPAARLVVLLSRRNCPACGLSETRSCSGTGGCLNGKAACGLRVELAGEPPSRVRTL